MSYCLNPACPQPQNPNNSELCQTCGSKLRLKERYRAVRTIGQGGFGRTLLAVDEDKPSQPRCVIKQLHPALGSDPQQVATLFRQEAERLDDLGKHPQIPALLAYAIQEQQQYLVQEFIDGQNLNEVLEAEGVFNERQIIHLLRSLLPVLEFIHSQHVIHRDVKPQNIIRRSNGDLALVDFGAAKQAIGARLLQTGTVIGSAEYVSPEQARGKAVFASDLYSLGITCLHLLTQVSPFELFDPNEDSWIWRDYLVSNPVGDRLGQILDRLVVNAVNRRYQSATEVIAALAGVSSGIKPVLSAPPRSPAPVASPTPGITVSPTPTQGWKCVASVNAHAGMFAGIRALALSPDGNTLASGAEDNLVKLWDMATLQSTHTLPEHTGTVRAIAFSADGADGRILATAGGKEIRRWSLPDFQMQTLPGHEADVTNLAFSPTQELLASGSDDCTIKLWDWASGEAWQTLRGDAGYIQALTFSPDGQTLASANYDWQIWLWSAEGQLLRKLSGHVNSVQAIAFSPDGQFLVSGSLDETLKIWNADSGTLRNSYKAHGNWLSGVQAIAISPDSQVIASGGGDKLLKLWSLRDGKLLQTLSGHSKGVTALVFSPDGQTLISGSYDKTLKIWRC